MGSWGTGPFDNDDASDFAGDLSALSEARSISVLLGDALLAVSTSDGYVESPEMSRAVAALAVVAVLAQPDLPAPSSLDRSWFESARGTSSDLLAHLAQEVLARAFRPDDNEWYELWDEAGQLDEVRGALAPYAAALRP